MISENINNPAITGAGEPPVTGSIDLYTLKLNPLNKSVTVTMGRGRQWTVGHSVLKRPIEIWEFAGGSEPSDEVTCWDTLFIGGFHGDEGLSVDLLRRFIGHCQAKAIAFNPPVRFGVLPVLNPDGLAQNTRSNANGVDLNRNWPTENWTTQAGPELGKGTKYYEGPRPASEPETGVLQALIEQHRPKKIVSVHTPYRVINYDGPAKGLAEAMAAQSGQPGKRYPVVASIGYSTPGSFGTYYGVERNIPVITLELPELTETGHAITVERLWQESGEALMAALAYGPCSD